MPHRWCPVLRHLAVRFLDITILAPELRRRVADVDLYDLTATNPPAAGLEGLPREGLYPPTVHR
jgi:hypothetical protein